MTSMDTRVRSCSNGKAYAFASTHWPRVFEHEYIHGCGKNEDAWQIWSCTMHRWETDAGTTLGQRKYPMSIHVSTYVCMCMCVRTRGRRTNRYGWSCRGWGSTSVDATHHFSAGKCEFSGGLKISHRGLIMHPTAIVDELTTISISSSTFCCPFYPCVR